MYVEILGENKEWIPLFEEDKDGIIQRLKMWSNYRAFTRIRVIREDGKEIFNGVTKDAIAEISRLNL